MDLSIFNSDDSGLFIRQAQFFIFPLRESFGEQNKNSAVVIRSSGRFDELRITFRAEKNIMAMGQPNVLEVTIYNLSAATKQLLKEQASNILLQVGYAQGDIALQTIASAGITGNSSGRDGPHVTTTVTGYDGMDGIALAVSSAAYVGAVRLKKIVEDLANDIPGIEVSPINIRINEGLAVGSKGRIFSGRTSTILSKLAREYGFNWTIDNGIFKAVEDVFITGNIYNISAEAGNLISANPRIDTISQRLLAVDIETILDPRIHPGDRVNLKSKTNPLVNNVYQVTAITHVGDTHTNVWQSNIQCILNDRQRFQTATSANATFQGAA